MAASDIKAGRAYVEIATDDKNLKAGVTKMSAELEQWCRRTTTIGMGAVAAASTVALPLGASMAVYANFESQMAKVAAITKATSEEVKNLREQAKLLGKTTFFSASQVADAQKFLGMAGFNAKDIEAGLPSVLNLALAGNIDIGQAADIASNISTPFGIAAKDIQRVTDLLATAATSSNTDVAQMGEAFKMVSAGAASAGQSIEEMSAGLAILANNGIQSTMAGTAMRKMLSTLADQSTQLKLKEAFNVDVTDAAGNMRPLLSILQDIEQASSKLTQTDQISVFFDLFGERAANAALLLGKSGDAAVDFRLKMMNALGGSAEMAKTMGDTLAGDFKGLMSAVEGTQIAVGEAFNGMSREAVKFATGSVRGIAEFISENQKLVQALGVSAVAVGTFGAASMAVGIGTPFFVGVIQNIETATSKLNIFKNAISAVKSQEAVMAASQAQSAATAVSGGPSTAKSDLLQKIQTNTGKTISGSTAAISGVDARLAAIAKERLAAEEAITRNKSLMALLSQREVEATTAARSSLIAGDGTGYAKANRLRNSIATQRAVLEQNAAVLDGNLSKQTTAANAEIATLTRKRAALERQLAAAQAKQSFANNMVSSSSGGGGFGQFSKMAEFSAGASSRQVTGLIEKLGAANTASTRWAASVMLMSNAEAAAAAKTALYGSAMSALNVKMVVSSGVSKTLAAGNAILTGSYKLLSAETYLAAASSAKQGVVQGVTAMKNGILAATNATVAASYKGLAGATLFASSATKALGAAIYAIPGWGWALAGIAALSALTTYLVSTWEHTAKLGDEMSKKRETGDNTRQVDDMKMRRLEQIAALEKQSDADKKEAAKLVGDLQGRYGDFGATIDTVTGSLSLAGNAMQTFMDAMNANAIRELEDELKQVENNLGELGKEAEKTSWYWRSVGANVTLGYVDTGEERLEKNWEKKAAELKKQHELKKKIAAIKGGDNAVDVAKTDESRVSERLSSGGKTASEVNAENVDKLKKLNEDLSRERKTQVENEIADVRRLSQEYQVLLNSLIAYEQKQVDAGLGDPSKLADYRKQLDDALGVEEERVMRILAKVEMPKQEDIAITQKKMVVSDLQLQLKTAKETGADTTAIEAALEKAKVELDVTELQQSGKNLNDASVELKAAIAAWEVSMKGGTAEEQAVAAENVKKAETNYNQAQSQYDTKSKILEQKPITEADAKLQLNLSNALVGGDKKQIETAKNQVLQSELAKALTVLQTAQTSFRDSLQNFQLAKETGNQSQVFEAQTLLSGNKERLDSASSTYENLKARLQDGLKETTEKYSVSGTFSAQAAAAMGTGTSMDRVAKATEKSEKHLEKLAAKTEKPESEVKPASEKQTGDTNLTKEVKNQTRYLRDIASKSGGVFV